MGERIDIVYLDDTKTANVLFDASSIVDLSGIAVRVLSPIHFSFMKAHAATQDKERRNRDLEDINQLYKRGVISLGDLEKIVAKYSLSDYFKEQIEKGEQYGETER